jgi:hypothetical protein
MYSTKGSDLNHSQRLYTNNLSELITSSFLVQALINVISNEDYFIENKSNCNFEQDYKNIDKISIQCIVFQLGDPGSKLTAIRSLIKSKLNCISIHSSF